MNRRMSWVIASVLAAMVLPSTPATAGETGAVYVGACAMDLHVSYSPPLTLVPTPTIVRISTASSTCVVNDELGTSSLSGELGPVFGLIGMSCEGGVATGRGTFRSSATGFPVTNLTISLVNTGGTFVLEANTDITVYRGVGVFEQDPAATASCLSGSPLGSARWTGTLAFEDPRPPI